MVCTCLKTSLVLSIALCARCILLYMVLLCGCCNICTGEVCPYTHARRIRLLLRRGRGGVFFVRASTTKGWVLGTTRDPRYLKSWSEGTQWSVIRMSSSADTQYYSSVNLRYQTLLLHVGLFDSTQMFEAAWELSKLGSLCHLGLLTHGYNITH